MRLHSRFFAVIGVLICISHSFAVNKSQQINQLQTSLIESNRLAEAYADKIKALENRLDILGIDAFTPQTQRLADLFSELELYQRRSALIRQSWNALLQNKRFREALKTNRQKFIARI